MANFWANSDLKSDPPPLGMSGLKPTAVLSEPPTNTKLPMHCNVEPVKGNINSKTMLKCFILSENKNNMLNIVSEFLGSDMKTYLTRLKSGKLKRF